MILAFDNKTCTTCCNIKHISLSGKLSVTRHDVSVDAPVMGNPSTSSDATTYLTAVSSVTDEGKETKAKQSKITSCSLFYSVLSLLNFRNILICMNEISLKI